MHTAASGEPHVSVVPCKSFGSGDSPTQEGFLAGTAGHGGQTVEHVYC